MFVALNIVARSDDGIFARLHNILTRPKIQVEQQRQLDIPFALVHAEAAPGQPPDWEELRWICSDLARWVLVPDRYMNELPADLGLRVFRGERFAREVLLQTACAMIHQTRMPMYRRVLGLLDEDGSSAHMLPQLLKYYTSVKVVTGSQQRYRLAAQEMMEELGAPVLVCDSLSALSDCVLVLCPGRFSRQETVRLPCPVLALEVGDCGLAVKPDVFSALEPPLPQGLQPTPGIAPGRFLAAMVELGGLEGVKLVAKTLRFNQASTTLDSSIGIISQNLPHLI